MKNKKQEFFLNSKQIHDLEKLYNQYRGQSNESENKKYASEIMWFLDSAHSYENNLTWNFPHIITPYKSLEKHYNNILFNDPNQNFDQKFAKFYWSLKAIITNNKRMKLKWLLKIPKVGWILFKIVNFFN